MTDTVTYDFGDKTTSSSIYGFPELDFGANLANDGSEVSEFIDTETPFILFTLEPGATLLEIDSSWGDIVNKDSRTIVTRTKTIKGVSFKEPDIEYTVPHFPISHSVKWYGKTAVLTRGGRTFKCNASPRICDLTYTFAALQFKLKVPSLTIARDSSFLVDISFKAGK